MTSPRSPPLLRVGAFIAFLLGTCAFIHSEAGAAMAIVSPVEEVVQRQVEAYNRHDLDAFANTYSDDVKIYRMPATEPAISGKEQLRKFYRDSRFNLPKLRGEIVHRTVLGNKIVDHERITGLRDTPVEAVVVYAIVDGHIATVWMFSPEP